MCKMLKGIKEKTKLEQKEQYTVKKTKQVERKNLIFSKEKRIPF